MATIRGKKGNFNDTLKGTSKVDYIYGYDGDDTINAGADNDFLYGGNGDDRLFGNDGHDRLYGEDGKDRLEGGTGHDLIDGGAEADTLLGDAGEDDLWGGSGDDILAGGTGVDELIGGIGADTLTGGADRDYFFWNARSDALAGDTITDFEAGIDVLGMMGAAGDANSILSGVQQWEFVSGVGEPLANGNGQATVRYDAVANTTTLRLYNNDGDNIEDFLLTVNGNFSAEQLQIFAFSPVTSGFTDPLIIFAPEM